MATKIKSLLRYLMTIDEFIKDGRMEEYDHSSMERKTYLPLIKAYVYEEGVDDYE